MPKPRKSQISLEATPYYHCTSRCVRRAFLCGRDKETGIDYEHRRGRIEARIFELAKVFALDICAYAVMSNHYHVVLHINAQKAKIWSMDEVIERWHTLFKGPVLSQRYLAKVPLTDAELEVVKTLADTWREHLMSISWFMKILNEGIAREANAEDGCKGHFWESRFKSQALLDEKALAACLAYVDLNPIRAKMAETPERSDYTSARKRIEHAKTSRCEATPPQPDGLLPFVGYPRQEMPFGLPFRLQDYLALLDWTGRQFHQGKRGFINDNLPPILERLNIDSENWLYSASNFESSFKGFVGTAQAMAAACRKLGYKRTPSISTGKLLAT